MGSFWFLKREPQEPQKAELQERAYGIVPSEVWKEEIQKEGDGSIGRSLTPKSETAARYA